MPRPTAPPPAVSAARAGPAPATSMRSVLAPLALTQFIASFAGSNMNVAINSIAADLNAPTARR